MGIIVGLIVAYFVVAACKYYIPPGKPLATALTWLAQPIWELFYDGATWFKSSEPAISAELSAIGDGVKGWETNFTTQWGPKIDGISAQVQAQGAQIGTLITQLEALIKSQKPPGTP